MDREKPTAFQKYNPFNFNPKYFWYEIVSMGLTLEQENALRRIKGDPLLDKLPDEEPPVDQSPADSVSSTPLIDEKYKGEPLSLTQDQVFAYLKEQGIEVTSLEDLKKKPEEDPERIAEKRQADILTYGLQKGKFSTKTYESFVRESNDLQNVVFQQFHAHAKQEDPELTPDEIQQEFAAKFGLDADPGTRRYKRGQQEIEVLAQNILHNKYSNIFEAQREFGVYEQSLREKSERANKIKMGLPAYKEAIEKTFANLSRIPAKFSDNTEYSVNAAEIMKDSIIELQNQMISPEYAAEKILKGYTADDLQREAWMVLLASHFPLLSEEIAKQYLLKHKGGTQGIPPKGDQRQPEQMAQSEEQQKALNRIFPEKQLAN